MPPRRSTRSASVQPPPAVEKPVSSKRKRGQASEEVLADHINTKPASRSRKPTSKAVSSTTRAKGRARPSLDDVPESEVDHDEEDSSPPVKKSRPSLDTAEVVNAEEEEDVKPAKSRRTSSRKPSSSKTARTIADGKEFLEEEKDVKPPRRITRSKPPSSTSQPTRQGSSRSAKATIVKKEASSDIEEVTPTPAVIVVSDSDAEEISPSARPTRDYGSKAAKAPRQSTIASPPPYSKADENHAVLKREPEEPPQPSAGTNVHDSEDEEQREAQEATPSPEPQQKSQPYEEERSLLDDIRPPSPKPSQQPATPEEPVGPKPRLVIHKMALVNFKSYAGRQEIGPFHKSFSAIVGPNGSGKSNTIDALLFVFGYRASKMRQGKLSELIHNSARYPDLDECSVEVHFREIIDEPNPDGFTVVPNSTLVVARTAFKNNSSRYTINGRQSTYSEVQTLLKGKGIDLDHNRFLILQGEVESIAQMKPKAPSEHEDGLLEYLEDIIGTSKYKQPIEEAIQEVERLNEDRAEKLNRLKIVERERNALEEQKREAEDYLRLQNEHVRALSRLWQWYLWRCLVNEEKFNEHIGEIKHELQQETEQNQDDITHLEALEKHYKERCAAYEEVKAAAAEAVKDLTAHEKEQVSLEERRKYAITKAKKLKKSLQEDERTHAEALRAIEENGAKIKKGKAKADALENDLAKEERVLEQIRDSLKDKTQVFHDQIEVKQKELQPWTTKINAKQAEIDVATSERDMLAQKADEVKQTYEAAKSDLEQLKHGLDNKSTELEDLRARKGEIIKEVEAAGRRIQELRTRVQELRTQAVSSRQRVDEAKASQAASTSQNKVLDSLTRLKNTGRISGFHGRLGTLGTIPDEYDVAVSTACGALNNLVVDTVEQGQACIEYLRKQSVGRASFLVLEKLSPRGMERIQTPENVPRLFDLIKPKEARFAPAFYKAVGNTLVAKDLDQANRIAFGARRWRVVTLSGQLIEASGAMSGGGNHVSRGLMSSKLQADAVSPETLRQYERDSEKAALQLEEALQQLREVEAELDALSKSAPQIDVAIEKVTLDLRTGSKRIAEAEKRVHDLKGQIKPDAGDIARIGALDREIAAATQKLSELQARTESIQEDIQALEDKIMEVGGARMLSQKSKVDGIRLHIDLANDEVTKAEIAKAKAEKDSTKLANTIETNTATLEELQSELEELNQQFEECTAYVEEVRSQVEAAQLAAENSKEDLENLKADLDTKTDEIQAFRQKEMELKQALADAEKEAAENAKALDHWQREHDKLKLEDIDDDDDEDEEQSANNEEDDHAQPAEAQGRRKRPASRELHMYTADELAGFKKRELVADAELLDEKLKNARPNLAVLKDYKKREEEFLRRADDLESVTQERDAQKQKQDELMKRRLNEFLEGFHTISLKLKEMYQMITLGGNAELELVDSMDPFSEGIIFSVMPPKKSWRNISNLSGGEKTLSSLALVFALHVYKPTPLYFMDEIDAALDFRNVSIVANYIKDRTKNAQFIIISLRNDMFELSHRLIGIYKTSNATRSISIDNRTLHSGTVNGLPN